MIKYKLKKIRKRKLILWISIILIFSLSLGTIARYYASVVELNNYDTILPIDGPTVIVNDYEKDWNYYVGLNYTEVDDRQQLSQIGTLIGNKVKKFDEVTPKYTEDNLIAVEINYSSMDINNDSLMGYVSGTEQQNKYTYYKYYPQDESGYITIELPDNPWSQRPTGYGFNGWVCDSKIDNSAIPGNTKDCSKYQFSYDSQYYTRYLKISTADIAKDTNNNKTLILNLRTSWVKADIKQDISAINTFNPKGVVAVSTNPEIESIFTDSTNTNQLTGYYYKTDTTDFTSGSYINSAGITCSDTNPCASGDIYKLIQSSDTSFNTSNASLDTSNYYYLVTRDTNIFEITTDNTISLDQLVSEQPFTATSSLDYSVATRTINSGNLYTKEDFVLENIKIDGGTNINRVADHIGNHIYDGTDYYNIFANSNTKIGRNVSAVDQINKYTLDSINGGKNVKVIVESGYYNDLVMSPTNTQVNDLENYAIYGSDYDRVTKNNSNLIVHFEAVSSTSYAHNSTDFVTPVTTMTVKSGTYGYGALASNDTNNIFYQYGIYSGTIHAAENSLTKSLRLLYVQGGKIVNINGGPYVSSDVTGISTAIYILDGEIENVVGGAGTAKSYGERIVSVTGGTIYNAVAGGSNSYTQEGIDTNGPLTANTFVYIGGTSKIGAKSGDTSQSLLVNKPTTLYGVPKRGSVYGGGLGRNSEEFTSPAQITGAENSGIVENSVVIINGGTVTGDVYGGGNYGQTGATSGHPVTTMFLKNGTVEGSVYGGGKNKGFGNKYTIGNIDINVTGGSYGNIYGGCNIKGLVMADVNINLIGGTVGDIYNIEPEEIEQETNFTGVYGGGYGAETFVNGDINIITNENSADLKIHNIYGGSANGTVNTTGAEIPKAEKIDLATTQVYQFSKTLEEGKRIRISGAKNGDLIEEQPGIFNEYSTFKARDTCVYSEGCPIYSAMPLGATINNGLENGVTYYVATTDALGNVNGMKEVNTDAFLAPNKGDVNITINGGIVLGSIFGGGLGETAAPVIDGIISVEIKGGKVENVYAGNDQQGDLVNKYDTVGRNYLDPATGKYFRKEEVIDEETIVKFLKYPSTVVVNGGEVSNVYGGGRNAGLEATVVEINDGTITGSVYGGNKRAASRETIVNLNGGTIENAFGGSNLSGTVTSAIVNNKPSSTEKNTTVKNTYGGGNKADVVTSVNNLIGATVTGNAFTGGKQANVTTGTLYLKKGTVANVFGGCDKDGTVATARTYIDNGTITGNVYGGNNIGGSTSENSLLRIDPTVCTDKICKVEVQGNIYGGGKGYECIEEDPKKCPQEDNANNANKAISNNTNTIIRNVTVGTEGDTSGNTGNIYGGGYKAKTIGKVKLYLKDVKAYGSIFGGGNHAPVLATAEDNDLITDPSSAKNPEIYVNLINNVTATNVYGGGLYGYVGNSEINSSNEFVNPLVANRYDIGSGNTYVNILNGEISNNVYGSGNASFVFGNTHVNIGDNAITNIEKQITDSTSVVDIDKYFEDDFNEAKTSPIINIHGSVYGGSETNTSESTLYDDSFKGVIGNAYVNISTNNYTNPTGEKRIKISRSIYGGGNNSAVTGGKSFVLINKLGTEQKPYKIQSLQRADYAFIVDSYLYIVGMQDRANASSTPYTLTRLKHLYLLGEPKTGEEISKGSTLYLRAGSTYLEEYHSGLAQISIENTSIDFDTFVQEEIKDRDGAVVPANVDNQIFIKQSAQASGVSYLAIAKGAEPVIDGNTTNAGSVHGMTYFGIYYPDTSTKNAADKITLDGIPIDKLIYDRNQVHNQPYTVDGVPSEPSTTQVDTYAYIFGKHDQKQNDQMTENGFFSHKYDAENKVIKIDFITPTPPEEKYYRWELGIRQVTIPVTIEANKYSQRTVVNADLNVPELTDSAGFWKDAIMTIKSFDTSNFSYYDEEYREDDIDDSLQTGFNGYLFNRSKIPNVNIDNKIDPENNRTDANEKFALEMGTTEAGWLNNYHTSFVSDTERGEKSYVPTDPNSKKYFPGDITYRFDSSQNMRSVSFWLYYSQNLDTRMAKKEAEEDDVKSVNMHTINVKTNFKNGANDASSGINIIFEITVKLTADDAEYYGTLQSPGKKYDIFQNKEISIPSDGAFSLYHKLVIDFDKDKNPATHEQLGLSLPISNVDELYGAQDEVHLTISGNQQTQRWGEAYRYLASSYKLPIGTRISMIDIQQNKEYFYEVTSRADGCKQAPTDRITTITNALNGVPETGIKEKGSDQTCPAGTSQYKYFLTDFIEMGTTDTNSVKHYTDRGLDDKGNIKYYYYHNDEENKVNMAIEEFIFIVDFNGVDKGKLYLVKEQTELPSEYMYLTMAHQYEVQKKNHTYFDPVEDTIVAPKGNPATDLRYRFTGDITSQLQLSGDFYDKRTESKIEHGLYNSTTLSTIDPEPPELENSSEPKSKYVKVYSDSDNLILRLNTYLQQTYPINNAEFYNITPVDTKFDDHSIGSKIKFKKLTTQKESDGSTKEVFVDETSINGLVATLAENNKQYSPYTDGAFRIPLSQRTSSINAALNFDFSKSSLSYGKYAIEVETFMSYDGVTRDRNVGTGDDVVTTTRYFYFELLDADYGLEIKMAENPEGNTNPYENSITHDVITGKNSKKEDGSEKIIYEVNVKNGLSKPSLKIGLQRRKYAEGATDNAIYSREYENIDYTNIFKDLKLELVEGDANEFTCINENNESPPPSVSNCTSQLYSIGKSDRVNNEMQTIKFKLSGTLNAPGNTESENPPNLGWKSGTYRVVVYLYDTINTKEGEQSVLIGETYEYLIIRSLDLGGDEPSPPTS